MRKFVLSLFFILFSATIALPVVNISINIIPSFIGYGVLYLGVNQFRKKSKHFNDIYYITLLLFFFSIFDFIYIILPFDPTNGLLDFIVKIINVTGMLFVSYKVIWGISEIEASEQIPMNTESCKSLWIYMAILAIVPLIINNDAIDLACLVGSVLIKFYLLYTLSMSSRVYNAKKLP